MYQMYDIMNDISTRRLIVMYMNRFINLEEKNKDIEFEFGTIYGAGEYNCFTNTARFDFDALYRKFFYLKKNGGFENLTYELFIKWVVLHEYCHSIDKGLIARIKLAYKEQNRGNFRNVRALILISEIICYKLMKKYINEEEKEMFRMFKKCNLYAYKKNVVIQKNFNFEEYPSKLREFAYVY